MNSDSSNHVKSNAGILILKILIFGIGIAGTCFLWVLGVLMIAFGFVNQTPMVIFMTLVLLSLLVMLYAFLFCKTRKIWKYSGVAEGQPKGNDQFFVVWKSIDWSRKTENGITAFRYMTGKRLGIFPIDEYFYLTRVE